ncbi:hypothetical protein MRX96_009731 [Rhipicephalus microplus]
MLEASSACPLGDLNKVVKLEEWAAVAAAPPGAYRYPHHHLHPPTPQPGPAPSGRQVGPLRNLRGGCPGSRHSRAPRVPWTPLCFASFRDRYLGASAPPFGGHGLVPGPTTTPRTSWALRLSQRLLNAHPKWPEDLPAADRHRPALRAPPEDHWPLHPSTGPHCHPGATSAAGNDKRSFVANEAPSGGGSAASNNDGPGGRSAAKAYASTPDSHPLRLTKDGECLPGLSEQLYIPHKTAMSGLMQLVRELYC